MDHFQLRNGELYCEDVPLAEIAEAVETPAYIYSTATLVRHVEVLQSALHGIPNPLIAYAVKANPNAAVLATLAQLGLGADVVSGGEIQRSLAAGIPAEKIVFSGVGKTEAEMRYALEVGVFQFNLESLDEADTLSSVATSTGVRAPVAFRVNPDVAADTHAKITTGVAESKFGIAIDDAPAAYAHASALPGLSIQGVAVHIGSQLTNLAPLEQAFTKVGELIAKLRSEGRDIRVADLGGGLGVPYNPDLPHPPSPEDYGEMVRRITRDWDVRLLFEPGRLIVGNAGVLLSRVVRVKPGAAHPFVIVDAAMNDLMRPALYDAWHKIDAVRPTGEQWTANVVGPVCETGDTFATARKMDRTSAGDLVAFKTAGAYAAAMSSTYNSRPLTPEVLVDGSSWAIIRPRVGIESLIAADRIPDWLKATA
ncbi:diaminopimelate decarboxylase [Sphingomonas sp. SM33]|uniref:Diaminopimelate decarboxylase n=1 Tax=Sphingomonas telluris TaxID=2907998 RepID=A0ABS9VMB3_9SPHN|nr:diaminopimelate decarboxylase [Sphingomonas telluris]MCH8616110.1 diaminopimelate decarboxylase [Sphingomonas telluris]